MSTPPPDTHFRPQLNQTLKDGRFTVLRKLGEGITSSTWLVRDSLASPEKYAAAKILTAEATQEPGPVRELDILREITKQAEEQEDDEAFDYLPGLYDHFTITSDATGPEPHSHLCLVMTLYSTSVSALRRSAPTKSLPVYMVRSFMYMTLHALRMIHSLRIAHTDVKLDNILFSNAQFSSDAALEAYIAEHPAELDPSDGSVPKSQPFPNEWTFDTNAHEAERMTVALIDFGHGEWVDQEPLAEGFCPISLRPPEVLLSAGISTAVDIWAIGCLTFELMTGRWLFDPEDGGEDWSIVEDHLAKILEMTGQSAYPDSVLARAKLRDNYFDKEGNLLRIPDLIPVSIEQAMANYNIPGLSEEDIREGADFIRSCLHLDHTQRKTAAELLDHPFAKKAFHC